METVRDRKRERELKGEGVKGLRDSLRVCVCGMKVE